MALLPKGLQAFLFHAKVLNTYPEVRLIDVEFINAGTIKKSVRVVQDSSTFSFPRKDEIGLCIGNDVQGYYYLGKMDFAYARKLNKEVTIPGTKTNWPIRKIKPGETYISHVLNGLGLLFTNSGNFSLTALNQDGIKYIYDKMGEPFRWLQATAKSILLGSITSSLSLGAVIRKTPVQGDKVIRSLTDPTKAAQEFLVNITKIIGILPKTVVKLHLGEILQEPVTNPMVPIPVFHTEVGLGGAAAMLQALLAVFNTAGIEIGSIKIDNLGNMSINTTLPGAGKLVINAGTNTHILSTAGTYIGGTADIPPIEPMVLGNQLSTWLAGHKHPTSMGLSGAPSPDDIVKLATILSPLNKLD